jgi:hypothetical protein
MHRLALSEIIERLEAAQGTPMPPRADPWRLVLWENVAYLADDERRDRAMRMLEQTVGFAPEQIFAATSDQLEAIAAHGILAGTFAEKLRSSTRLKCHRCTSADAFRPRWLRRGGQAALADRSTVKNRRRRSRGAVRNRLHLTPTRACAEG